MNPARRLPFRRAALLGVLGALVLPSIAAAQGGEGFLFKQPRVTLKFETGYSVQSATGDYLDFTRSTFTVGWRDFDAPYVGGEIAFRAAERWDVALGVGLIDSSVESEYREYVGTDDLPIEQVTELRIIPVTLSAKYYLNDRGRSVGRFAWVPNTFAPYIGGGVGFAHHRFEQWGDFVDEQSPTLPIYFARLVSEGETPLARALAGLSVSLGKQLELVGEGRYTFASADMSRQFDDAYGPIDLNGFQAVVGVGIRF